MTDQEPPENELGHRRRVMEQASFAATSLHELMKAVRELHELGVPAIEWLDIVVDAREHPLMAALVGRLGPLAAPFLDGAISMACAKAKNPDAGVVDAVSAPGSLSTLIAAITSKPEAPVGAALTPYPMDELLDRLFAEAPKMTNPDGTPDETQAPAVQCHVLLRGAVQPLFGAMSTTPEGLLRMLTPATIGKREVLAESFFSIGDIVSIMVEREVKGEQSRIVTS